MKKFALVLVFSLAFLPVSAHADSVGGANPRPDAQADSVGGANPRPDAMSDWFTELLVFMQIM